MTENIRNKCRFDIKEFSYKCGGIKCKYYNKEQCDGVYCRNKTARSEKMELAIETLRHMEKCLESAGALHD